MLKYGENLSEIIKVSRGTKYCISISPVTRVSLLKFQNGERAQWEGK